LREEPIARPPRTRESGSALERQLTRLERLAPLNAAIEEGGEKGDWMAAPAWVRRASALSEGEAHPSQARFQLARAHLGALKSEWREVEAAL
jgi:hypothetical protein